jgi:hypothetical protein
MIKFLWCLGHSGSGRFRAVGDENDWKCMDCGAVMEKTGVEPDGDKNWRLVQEVIDDSD